MFQNNKIVITACVRTPMGSFQGRLSSLTGPELGASAISACLQPYAFLLKENVEVIMGCVLSAGCGQAPARQSALLAGLPNHVSTTTINKVCGSGLKSVMLGCALLKEESINILIAGGMESMSNAPYFSKNTRGGQRLGHSLLQDHIFYDGLEDAYTHKLMGVFAQETANHYCISRHDMDDYALMSLERARTAMTAGQFKNEITPVIINNHTISTDEPPEKAKPEKIRTLKPVFSATGTITAANSSSIADGAAALCLMKYKEAHKKSIAPIAFICGYASYATVPEHFTIAPAHAVKKLLHQLEWKANEVDLYEINEAFAVVSLLCMKDLNISVEQVNIHGGACALGHPLGASGARILVTLIYALQQTGGKRGIATLCIGGGEAVAIAIEMY